MIIRAASCGLAAALLSAGCAVLAGATGPANVSGVRRIAILPLAYRGREGGRRCDLCPQKVVLAPTSSEHALLVTAFFYEELTKHPRFEVVPYEQVGGADETSMAGTLARLERLQPIDAVIVGALLELRPRLGDPDHPYRVAGAAIYLAAVDPSDGHVLWSGVYDEDERPPSLSWQRFRQLTKGESLRTHTALEMAHSGVETLVARMVSRIR